MAPSYSPASSVHSCCLRSVPRPRIGRNGPIVMVVSQSAGASSDIMARLLANPLSERLGQGVVVENKTGGGNVIGANAVARSSPDFEPVALVTRSHQVVVVHPGVGRQDARAADCPGKGFAWKAVDRRLWAP